MNLSRFPPVIGVSAECSVATPGVCSSSDEDTKIKDLARTEGSDELMGHPLSDQGYLMGQKFLALSTGAPLPHALSSQSRKENSEVQVTDKTH